MVKIIDLDDDSMSEEDVGTTGDDTTEEEDDGIEVDIDKKLPYPPDLPDPRLSVSTPEANSAPEPSASVGAAGPSSAPEGIRRRTFPPSFPVGTPRYLWNVIAQYGHYVEFQRSLRGQGYVRPPGPDGWTHVIRQQAGPPNAHGDLQFVYGITAPDRFNSLRPSPETNSENNRGTASEINVPATETASHTTEEAMDEEEGNTHSDDSTKEKNNGVGEKEQLAATAAKANLLASPDLSDCELSDVSDSQAPPDYDALQAELIKEYTSNEEIKYRTTSLTECPWTPVRETCQEDLDPELTDSMDTKDPTEASEEGEAACLPVHSVVKDCWEQWVDDDRLFNFAEDINAPSTSTGTGDRTSSPPNPTGERRRVKMENRQRALERERAARPIKRFIFVPTEKIGRILGKGGRRIREIEKKSGAMIKVENRRSNKPVTQLTLTGTDEQISKADEEICIIIRNFKPPKSGEATTASVSSQEEHDLKLLLIGIKNQVIDAEKRCPKP